MELTLNIKLKDIQACEYLTQLRQNGVNITEFITNCFKEKHQKDLQNHIKETKL